MLSVKDFGAMGDGVTDDTAAIQSAMNSMTNGGVLFVPGGTYIVSATLTIPYSNIKLLGSGNASVLKAANTSNYETMLLAIGLNGIEVSDLVVDANRAGRTGLTTRTLGIELRSCSDSTVNHCMVHDTVGTSGIPGVGIAISGTSFRCKVTGCILKDCGIAGKASDGIYTSGTQTLIMNCIALNCTDTAFVIENSNQSGIVGCTARSCGAGAAITNALGSDVSGNFIDGLTVYDWTATVTGGIQIGTPIATTGALRNTRVSNVTLERVTGTGPALYVNKQGAQTIGLSLENIRVNGAGTQGILFTATDVMIANCHVYNTTNAGIQALGSCQRVVIQGCYINGGSFGIILADGCSDCSLVSNVIIGVAGKTNYGIYCFGTETNINCTMNMIQSVGVAKIGYDAGTMPNIFSANSGSISTNAAATASTLGSVSRKLPVYDKDGGSIGFLPVYSNIT